MNTMVDCKRLQACKHCCKHARAHSQHKHQPHELTTTRTASFFRRMKPPSIACPANTVSACVRSIAGNSERNAAIISKLVFTYPFPKSIVSDSNDAAERTGKSCFPTCFTSNPSTVDMAVGYDIFAPCSVTPVIGLLLSMYTPSCERESCEWVIFFPSAPCR
jgi:hypothetical protein